MKLKIRVMKKILVVSIIIILVISFQSCNKSDNDQILNSKVEFIFPANTLKSSGGQGLTDVVVTIEDLNGNVVKDSERIKIYYVNGNYVSQSLSLVSGEYKLSRFMVLNSNYNVVYASPVKGSVKANQVNSPLSLQFTAQNNSVTKVSPELLSAAESLPEDFGYVSFSFDIAGTFDFLVGAFVFNEVNQNFELTDATITILSGTLLIYTGQLQVNTDLSNQNNDSLNSINKISLPEKYFTYTIMISKKGYITYNKVFTKEELRLHYRKEDKGPLVAKLEKGCDCPPVVTDIDGNMYLTVAIGKQCWMKENLKVTKFNDGTSISLITDSLEWLSTKIPAYCWYDNNEYYKTTTYGALYNGYAVDSTMNGGKNIAPEGWHVPSETEWMTLINYLGGHNYAGGKMKESGTSHWSSPNTGATNASGFTALPGGIRGDEWSKFYNMGLNAIWFCRPTESVSQYGILTITLDFQSAYIYHNTSRPKNIGLNVRCIKDSVDVIK
jgi:uncharacterized protein (TIGR02145 family)